MKIIFYALFVFIAGHDLLHADDFFTIENVLYRQHQGDGPFLHKDVDQTDKDNKTVTVQVFTPYLEAQVTTKGRVKADTLTARAYFYDSNKNPLESVDFPVSSTEEVFINPDQKQALYFVVPDDVLAKDQWSAIIVFGDDKGVDVQSYPNMGEETEYTYQESKLFDRTGPPIDRKPTLDPLVEYAVQTEIPDSPKLTLFMRVPDGIKDISQVKGVIALSLLSEDLWNIRRNLQDPDVGKDVTGMLDYADQHKFIVICWGSRGLWNPTKNWDDQSLAERKLYDDVFDKEANAWAKGVDYLIGQYGIPKNNYLLWGESGSAQYDCRLALRKPQYFLAVRLHIESSYDQPTVGGSRILWCLTTGEQEAGYQRSLRFYAQCRKLGYPMVYKAIPGIGHEGSDAAHELGTEFFDYALTLADQRNALDQSLAEQDHDPGVGAIAPAPQPWPAAFRTPPFVGDIVNQEVFSSDQQDMVPPGFRTPLPTKTLAETWNQ